MHFLFFQKAQVPAFLLKLVAGMALAIGTVSPVVIILPAVAAALTAPLFLLHVGMLRRVVGQWEEPHPAIAQAALHNRQL